MRIGWVISSTTRLGVVLSVVAASLLHMSPSGATLPGSNGRLLVTKRVHGVYQVFSMSADGTHQTRLTHLKRDADLATSSPDGSRIAFGAGGGIWVMDPDGSHQEQLTATGDDFQPTWSPDGGRLAFTRSTHGSFTIAVMHADGTHQRTVVDRGKTFSYGADWSPDGASIAFTSFTRDGAWAVFTVHVKDRHVARVPITLSPDTIGGAAFPSWSPDGSKFVFSGQPVSSGKPTCRPKRSDIFCQDLYVVAAAGGVPVRLTDDDQEDYAPIWSPDGTKIAFSHDDRAGGCSLFLGPPCILDVFTVHADGSHRQRVTHAKVDTEADWWMVG